MQQSTSNENSFVVDLLTTLQQERFSLVAWRHFLVRSWNMACQTAKNIPSLIRSWLRMTILMAMLVCSTCITVAVCEGSLATLRLLPGFIFCVAWQQCDFFWHLGLNRHTQTDTLFPTLGLANILTGLRGLGVAFLLGRLLGGLATPLWLALTVFLFGVLTDILDGLVARRTQTQSRLGQLVDSETDFCLYGVLSLLLMQAGVLPLWLGLILILRFLIPLIAALYSYFLLAHPVRFGSTLWGKCAGFTQCLYFLVLLLPPQLTSVVHIIHLPLLLAMLFFMVAAPIAQIVLTI